MATELVLKPLQGALHAAGLVAMHAACNDHHGTIGVPGPAAHRKQRITGPSQRRVVENTVLEQLGLRGKASFERRHHLVGVAALRPLAGQPCVSLGRAPGRPRNADRVGRDRLRSTHDRNTLSARTRIASGIRMPRAFADCRFNTSSTLVGCSTGSWAGFAPLRISRFTVAVTCTSPRGLTDSRLSLMA